MEVLNGETIFWLIALGMLIGAIMKLVMWRTQIGIVSNMIAGVAGTLIVGAFMIELQLAGAILFSLLGGLTTLFILNVFYLKTEESH